MYESHFALNGSPFQLNPDPSFYFDSRGHNNALAYLNFGVHQGEGFIVVTGDVGAGKTTLVRKLLSSLNAGEVVAAQIASTQLGADDLLRSVLKAFGETAQGRSKAEVIGALEAYLTSLCAVGRRALLVVDEAQNLQPEAIEELRMLSNFQWGPKPVLQSFLVGQPELRGKLQLPWMEQLRQRVIASCHLGPLEPPETRAYVEHRLLRVGWSGRPSFDQATFEQVHRWAQGIPRRINLLCNRLMLAAYLGNADHISAHDVARVAADFKAELGGRAPAAEATPAAADSAAWQPVPAADESAPRAVAGGRALVELRRGQGTGLRVVAPIFCVVDTPSTRLRCAVLAQAFEAQPDMPAMLVVHPGRAVDWALDETQSAALPEASLVAHLEVPPGPYAAYSAELQLRFADLLRQWSPAAVLLPGRSDATLACALVAAKQDQPVFRLASSAGWWPRDRKGQLNGALLETLTEMRLLEGDTAGATGRGPTALAHPVGSLMAAALAQLRPVVPALEQVWQRLLASAPEAGSAQCAGDLPAATGLAAGVTLQPGFVLVAVQWLDDVRSVDELATLLAALHELARRLPVVWPLEAETRRVLTADGALQRLASAGVHLVRPLTTLESLGLLQAAGCLVCGHGGTLSEEAETWGIPVVGPGEVMKQAVLAATGLAGAVATPRADPAQAGADIVGLLRRWRLRERLADGRGSAVPNERQAAGIQAAGADPASKA